MNIGNGLRVSWPCDQRGDAELSPAIVKLLQTKPDAPHAESAALFTRGVDGLLERCAEADGGSRWVLAVPKGKAHKIQSWRQWFFAQMHCGPRAGHRGEEATFKAATQSQWWREIASDIKA